MAEDSTAILDQETEDKTSESPVTESVDNSTVNNQPIKSDDLIDVKEAAPKPPDDLKLDDLYLPDAIRNDPTIKNLEGKTLTDMANMLIAGQKMIGADKFVIPGKDATPDEWTAIYKKLGRPDTPDAYNFKEVEEIPENIRNPERVGEFAKLVHEEGLSSKQANRIFQFHQEMTVKELARMEASKEELLQAGREALMKEYGNAFEEKCRLANSVLRNTRGGEEFRQALKDADLGNDPRVIKFLADTVGPNIGEDRLVGLDTGRSSSGANTPEEAKAKIAELRAKEGFGIKGHPQYATIMNEYTKLVDDAYPEGKAG